MRKHLARQTEIDTGAEPFALIQETAIDWSRVKAETEHKARERASDEQRQADMFGGAQ